MPEILGGDVRQAGTIRGNTLRVGLNEQDKLQNEFLRIAMGNTGFRALENTEDSYVQERVPESYGQWVKDGRPNYGVRRISEIMYALLDGGDPWGERMYEASTTSSMSSIVKNTVNIMLAADYAKKQKWYEPIVTIEEVDTIDTATLVRVYGFDSLDVVNEGNAYTEMDWVDQEETATFIKKGNYVGVTLETLLADKLNVIRIPAQAFGLVAQHPVPVGFWRVHGQHSGRSRAL